MTMPRKKKSCSGCRALDGNKCELGYRVARNINQRWKAPEPLERCPKPLTYDAYFAERDRLRRLNNFISNYPLTESEE